MNDSTSDESEQVSDLLLNHFEHLCSGSGINVDVIRQRGYRSVTDAKSLSALGFSKVQCRAPGLLMPTHSVDGKRVGYQFRPDKPRLNKSGKAIKYETPHGAANRVDCPPRCQQQLGNPKVPIWITEGIKKADALASHGACAIGINGVWGWKGTNENGGKVIVADLDHIAFNGRRVYLCFDSDTWTNPQVEAALMRLAQILKLRGAEVLVVHLPDKEEPKNA